MIDPDIQTLNDSPRPLRFSVVIPALNEASNISRCLASLASQTFSRDEFEVIVVDNGSTDETVATANSYADRLRLTVVGKTNCNVSEVRNFGASKSRGQILAFLDSDCFPKEDWLERSASIEQPGLLWGAHYLVPEDCPWVGKVWFAYQAVEQAGETSFIPASNLFMSRADFMRIGGFGKGLTTSEDVDLSLRARAEGIRVAAFPQLAVIHQGTPRTLLSFYRQNRWHGTDVIRVFLANLPSSKNLPLVLVTAYTFVVFWCLVFSVVFAVLSDRGIVLIPCFLCLLIAPPLLFSLRKTAMGHRIQDTPQLFVLYLIYLLARAASILHLSRRAHR